MDLDHERFRRIAAALPGVIFELERPPAGALTVAFVGGNTVELFGAPAAGLDADMDTVLGAVHPEDRPELLAAFDESACEGTALQWTGRAFAADGSLKHVQVLAATSSSPGGGTRWSGTIVDQTEARWEHALESAMRRRLQLIVEHLPASSVVLYDRHLRLCFCEGELFAGADLGAMMGRPLPELVDPSTFALLRPGIETVLAGGAAAPVVLEADRQGRALSINFAAYRLPDGRIDGVILHWQDISRLQAAERGREEAEELLRRGFDDAPIGMALLSLDGHWLRVNEALCETVGYGAGELIAMTFADITHPDDLTSCRRLVASVLDGTSRSRQFEKRYVRRDGTVVWVRLTVSLANDSAGRPLYLVAQIEDITERRRAERELANAREEIDRFFELSPELMAIGDAEGRFVRVNPAFKAALGYDPGDLVGRRVSALVHPEDLEAATALRAQMREGERLHWESRWRHREGGYRWLQWSASALRDGFIYAVARDVTERRGMEAALRESREEALSASRLKSAFVANMSHEIRTPLNGVLSMSEFLLGTELTAEQREYAQVTMTSAHALMRVIDDILDFSKIEAGKLEILHDDYHLAAVVADVCEIVGPSAREKGLELSCTVEPRVPAVLRGDAGRMRQVLMNLVGNAVKFTAEGRVSVRVALSDRAGEEGRLRLEVTDTGIGIEAPKLESLFEPFSQADATTTRRYGGTGLGLSIARQLVDLMDGELGVSSTPGRGSTFWLELPCVAGAAAARTSDVADGGPPAGAAPSGGVRVLVAEDNEINQFVAVRLLQKLGYTVELAGNGREAIEMSAESAYAAIFMDCQMPEVDGYRAAAEIRRREGGGRRTPIIAMTANTMAGDRERCLAAGMDDYLPKPLRFDHVAATCRTRVGGSPAAISGPPPSHGSHAFDARALGGVVTPAQAAAVLELYLEQLDTSVPELADALDAGELESARSLAHRLKGGSATVGAGAVAAACAEIGAVLRAAADGETVDVDRLHALGGRLRADAGATGAAIREHLGQLAAAA